MRIQIGISLPLGASKEQTPGVWGVARDVERAILFARKSFCTSYKLEFRDNQFSAQEARKIAEEFRDKGVAGVLGLPMSKEVKDSAGPLQEANIAVVSSMATSPQLREIGSVFRTRPGDDHASKLLLSHIQQAGYKTIATISEDADYPCDCTDSLVQLARNAGLTVLRHTFPAGSNDIAAQLKEISLHQVDAVFINAQEEYDMALVLRQLCAVMPDVNVLGSATAGSRKFIKHAGELANGMIFADEPSLLESLTIQGKGLLSRFRRWNRRQFGDTPDGAPHTWSGATISTISSFFVLHHAIEAKGDAVTNLRNRRFGDPMSGPFRFESNERVNFGHERFRLKQISNGSIITLPRQ